MSKSLNKISTSVFGLSQIFYKFSKFEKVASNAGGKLLELQAKDIGKAKEANKNVLQRNIDVARQVLAYYLSVYQELNKKIGKFQPTNNTDLRRVQSLTRRERNTLGEILEQLPKLILTYQFIINDKDQRGFGNLIDLIKKFNQTVNSFDSKDNDLIQKTKNSFFSKILDKVLDDTNVDNIKEQLNKMGISTGNVSEITEEIGNFESELEDDDDGQIYKKYTTELRDSDLEEMKNDLIEECGDTTSQIDMDFKDAAQAVLDRLKPGEKGEGKGGERVDKKDIITPLRTLEQKTETLQRRNNDRTTNNQKIIKKLKSDLSRAIQENNDPQRKLILKAIYIRDNQAQMLRSVDEIIKQAIKATRMLAQKLEEDESADITQDIEQLKEIFKEFGFDRESILDAIKGKTYRSPDVAQKMVSLSEPNEGYLSVNKNNSIIKSFVEARNFFIKCREKPEYYSGEKAIIFKEEFRNFISLINDSNIAIKNIANDRSFKEKIDSFLMMKNDIEKESLARNSEKNAWTRIKKSINAIQTIITKEDITGGDRQGFQSAVNDVVKNAPEIMKRTSNPGILSRIREIVGYKDEPEAIEKIKSDIDKDPFLKLKINLDYAYGRLPSDITQFERNALIGISASPKEKIDEVFSALKSSPELNDFKKEIFIEMYLTYLQERKKEGQLPKELSDIKFTEYGHMGDKGGITEYHLAEMPKFIKIKFPNENLEMEDLPTIKGAFAGRKISKFISNLISIQNKPTGLDVKRLTNINYLKGINAIIQELKRYMTQASPTGLAIIPSKEDGGVIQNSKWRIAGEGGDLKQSFKERIQQLEDAFNPSNLPGKEEGLIAKAIGNCITSYKEIESSKPQKIKLEKAPSGVSRKSKKQRLIESYIRDVKECDEDGKSAILATLSEDNNAIETDFKNQLSDEASPEDINKDWLEIKKHLIELCAPASSKVKELTNSLMKKFQVTLTENPTREQVLNAQKFLANFNTDLFKGVLKRCIIADNKNAKLTSGEITSWLVNVIQQITDISQSGGESK
jgi:hypothetical protein